MQGEGVPKTSKMGGSVPNGDQLSEREASLDEITANVMGRPPAAPMTQAMYRFFHEHSQYMSLFLFTNSLATQADFVRTTAAKALAFDGSEESVRAESRATLEKPTFVFDRLKSFGALQSRNLLLSAVNNFLCYFSEAIQAAMLKRPEILRSSATMRIDEVLTFKSRSELIAHLVDRQVNDLSYGGLARMEEYMRDRLGIAPFPTAESRSMMVIAIELRNIHTHNRGVVNDLFLGRVKDRMSYSFTRGEQFNFDWDGIHALTKNNIETAFRIDEELDRKFKVRRKSFKAWKGGMPGRSRVAHPTIRKSRSSPEPQAAQHSQRKAP